MKRDFELPPEDVEYLSSHFAEKWEAILDNNQRYIIIRNYDLPSGYNQKQIDLMIVMPENYPPNPLDMFFAKPEISRENNIPIETVSIAPYLNENWQQWSRHYDWDASKDTLVSHLLRVDRWLRDEAS